MNRHYIQSDIDCIVIDDDAVEHKVDDLHHLYSSAFIFLYDDV